MTKKVVQRESNCNVLRGCSIAVRCVQRVFNGNDANVLGVSHSFQAFGNPPFLCHYRGGEWANIIVHPY